MTREEAYNRIDAIIARHEIDDVYVTITNYKDYDALRMAREILEQEPCEDSISREFIEIVVDYPPADLCIYPEYRGKPYFSIKYRENGKTHVGFGTYKIEMLSQWIKEYFMPSIQPKPKTGHWEWVQYDYNSKLGDWHCSECKSVVIECVSKEEKGGIPLYKYCPQCGAKVSEIPTYSEKE